jgi:hypothetical protein
MSGAAVSPVVGISQQQQQQQASAPTAISSEEIQDQLGNAATVTTTNGVTLIRVKANQQPRIRVASNQALTNVLVDLSAPQSHLSIDGGGSNWAIQNVGYRGRASWGAKDNAISARVENGGEALIENVYLGDGSVPGRQTGIFVAKPTTGTLRINRVNVQEWPDNGIYGSALGPSNGGAGGTVHISNSLSANNVTSNFRLSDGGSLTNSVSLSTTPGPAKGGSSNVRGLWARDGGETVQVANTMMHHPTGQQTIVAGLPPASVAVSNSAIDPTLIDENGGSVSLSSVSEVTKMVVPQGVPGTAEAAASGSAGGPVSVGGPNTGPSVGPFPVTQIAAGATIMVLGIVLLAVLLSIAFVALLERNGGDLL